MTFTLAITTSKYDANDVIHERRNETTFSDVLEALDAAINEYRRIEIADNGDEGSEAFLALEIRDTDGNLYMKSR